MLRTNNRQTNRRTRKSYPYTPTDIVGVGNYTLCSEKKPPLTFSIITPEFLGRFLIFFVSVEREINTLQYTYLQSWWHHNCVTVHFTKAYFMEYKDEHWTTLLRNTHFCLNYNSGVSWSIFILFDLMETGVNTLQRNNKIYKTTLIVSPHYLT